MKKFVSIILIAVTLFSLSACSQAPEGTYPKIGKYLYEDDIYPRLSLEENKGFTIVHVSTYERITEGTYNVEKNILTLTADDGSVYVFKVKKETLEFDADSSSAFGKTLERENEILDGDKFLLVRNTKQ